MRVLMVQHRGDVITGGVEQWLLRVASHCRAHDIELFVALPEPGPLQRALITLGIPTKVVDVAWQPRTRTGWSRYIQGLSDRADALAEWVITERIELIHSNTQYLFEGPLAALRSGRPHVWHLRSTYDQDALPYAFGGLGLDYPTQVQWMAWLTDGLLSVSADAARIFLDQGHPVRVLPNGLDVTRYAEARPGGSLRAELGWPETTPVIASIARVSPEKDLPTFVRVCQKIRETLPQARFLIIGNTEEAPAALQALQATITACGLADALVLLGQRHDLPGLYPQMDLVLLTSLHEGQPNVLMEAMASGVPVVATRCGGPERLIDHEVHGLLANVQDVPGLAAAALRLLGDRDWARRLALAGRERVAREFSIARQLDDLRAYYAGLFAAYDTGPQNRKRALADAGLAFAAQHGQIHLTLLDQEARIRRLEQGANTWPGAALIRHLKQRVGRPWKKKVR